jgi:hypothetical protein
VPSVVIETASIVLILFRLVKEVKQHVLATKLVLLIKLAVSPVVNKMLSVKLPVIALLFLVPEIVADKNLLVLK